MILIVSVLKILSSVASARFFGRHARAEASLSWLLLIGALTTSALISAASIVWHQKLQKQLLVVEKTNAELTRAASAAPGALIAASDFVSHLPGTANSQRVVDALQRAGREAGVSVTSITVRDSLPKPDQLGRLEIAVTAQGPYPALKQVLVEWLARFPSATVRSQQWRRVDTGSPALGAGALAEASWVISVWTAPPGSTSTRPNTAGTEEAAAGQATASAPTTSTR